MYNNYLTRQACELLVPNSDLGCLVSCAWQAISSQLWKPFVDIFLAKTFYIFIFMLARTVLKQGDRETSEHQQDLTRPLTLSKNSCQSNWLCWLNGGKAKAYIAQRTRCARVLHVRWATENQQTFYGQYNFRLRATSGWLMTDVGAVLRRDKQSASHFPWLYACLGSDWLRLRQCEHIKNVDKDVRIKSKSAE